MLPLLLHNSGCLDAVRLIVPVRLDNNAQQCYVCAEPSAELLMDISRSRRLIVLLSYAYLEQDWCSNNFRSDCL